MTIISNTYGFVFIHIPKTAGTTVSVMLGPLTRWNDISLGGTEYGENIADLYRKRFGIGKHTRISQIKNVIGDSTFDKFYKFAFVRDPYTRAYSMFRHLKKWRAWSGSEIMDTFDDFASFLNSPFFLEGSGPDDIFVPQFRWLCNEEGELLTNYIGRLEAINDAFSHLKKILSLPVEFRDLPVKNQSSEPTDYLSAYSAESAKIVRKLYQRDFELFSYDPYRKIG